MRLAVTKMPEENHQLTLVWKTIKEYNNINNNSNNNNKEPAEWVHQSVQPRRKMTSPSFHEFPKEQLIWMQ